MAGDRQTLTKWLIVLAIVIVDTLWISLSDFTFAAGSALKVVAIVSLLLSVGWFYRVKRPMQNFEVMCSETALLLAFSTAGAVLSYLVTSFNLPLIDPFLVKTDAALGFDWLTYAGFVNHHPWLSITSTIVYVTTISQVALCVIALGLSGRISRGRQLGAAVIFSGLICVLTAGILPSAGALGYLRPGADVLGAGQHIVDLEYKQVFFDLRSGVERFISLDNLHGLVAFPSYHGTLSALVVISLWAFRFWRWPALALNFCVILATPVEGGHHLTDALSGVAVAFLAWHLAAAFMRKVPATPLTEPLLEPQLASAKR
jgi:membrane-associated phospholipid phosphatase